jgi:hypothetical protein
MARKDARPKDTSTCALLKDCTNPREYYHRYDASTGGLTAYYYYDEDGFLSGASIVSSDAPFCCDGVETDTLLYGDPAADPCVVPDEPDDKGDGKSGPCGGGAGGGAALFTFGAALLLTRRRRPPSFPTLGG